MKKIVLVLVVALMGTMAMNAQPPRGNGYVQDRVEQLTKELGLDEDQKAQVAEILKEGMSHKWGKRPEMKQGEKPDKANADKADRTDKADKADKMSRRDRIMEEHAAVDAKIVKVLTPEQRQKYEQFRLDEQKREGDKGRHHGKRPHGDRPKMSPKDGDNCKAGKGEGCCSKPQGQEQPNAENGKEIE